MEVAGWFIGAGIGTLFTALYEGVKKLMNRSTKFQTQLQALKLTLDSFDPEVIQQLEKINLALGFPNDDVKALREEMIKGVKIVEKLSDARLWNRIDSGDIKQLSELNRSLTVLERRLKMQSVREVKETRYIVEIMLRMTVQQQPRRDISFPALMGSMQVSDGNSPLTSSMFQHIQNCGDLQGNFQTSWNLPSTSASVLQHIQNSGDEIQEIGSSNYRGSENKPKISNGLAVVSIVLKVELTTERSRTKALKIAAKTQGVSNVSIFPEKEQLEVIGTGVDPVFLVSSLRKKMRVEVLISVIRSCSPPLVRGEHYPPLYGRVVEELQEEEKPSDPIRRTSRYVKIRKWFQLMSCRLVENSK